MDTNTLSSTIEVPAKGASFHVESVLRFFLALPLILLREPVRLFFRLWYGIGSKGWQHLPSRGGVLIAPNHLGWSDAIVVWATCPRPVRMVGASGLLRFPWMRLVFWVAGVIPVRLERPREVLKAVTEALHRGEAVVIFPEGALSLDGHLLPLRRGVVFMARQANVPVVPVRLDYRPIFLSSLMRAGLHISRASRYHCSRALLRTGDPLNPDTLTMTALREALLDTGAEAFAAKPHLNGHLADQAVRSLARHPFKKIVVDLSTGRRELKAGMLLAASYAMSRRWARTIPEKRVGVVFPSSLGGLITNLALTLAGKVPVNFNFTAGRKALEKSIEIAGVKTVITAKPVISKLPDDFPWPQRVIDLVEERKEIKKPTVVRYLLQVILFPGALLSKLWRVPTQGGEAEAGLLFSSGSTGDPKGIILTHRNVLGNCEQIKEVQLLHNENVLMANLPTFHSFGFTVTLWYPLLTAMKIVTLPSPLETKRVAAAVEQEGVTCMVGTPTFLRPYFKRVKPEQMRSLRFVIAGAEKTPEGFAERWEKTFGSIYLEGYGLTETSPVVGCNLPSAQEVGLKEGPQTSRRRQGSIGPLLPGMVARVSDPVTGETLPMNTTGMLELKGVNIFPGYLDDPAQTAKVFRDGWFVTGDLARLDEEGFIYIEGRVSRFSKIGGEMVPHGTVEQSIMHAFHLEDADEPLVAVTGVTDAAKGESLVLLSAVEISAQTLREKLAQEGVPNLWIPRTIRRVEEIPCLASGKLDLRELKRLAEG